MTQRALGLAVLGLIAVCSAGAQDSQPAARTVSEVRLEGLERVSAQMVSSKLKTQAGKPFSAQTVSQDIRRLYELGYFDHIRADGEILDGSVLVAFVFTEKKIIRELRIIGKGKIRLRDVRRAISWKEGEPYDASAQQEERNALLKLYESKGFPNAQVDIVVESLGPGGVRVTYLIDEGRRARIRQISFVGNQALSRRKLNKIMKTNRAFLFFGGRYEEEKFEADLRNILEEYGNLGRLEAAIPRVEMAYENEGKRLELTLHIVEGPVYHVETLDIANNMVYDDDEVRAIIEVHEGDVHNKGQVAKDAETIEKGYHDSGYVNAEVHPRTTLDREAKTTHIVDYIEEGDLRYVKEIKVTGNEITRDDVIRRVLLLGPGERFDGGLVEASKRRIENTEYFDEIRLTLEDEPESDLYTNLLVDVDEGKTGNFNFGAGYSTEEQLGGFAEIRWNNFDIGNWPRFTGGGQQFSIRANIGQVRTQYAVSFTDPEFAGYPLAFGVDLINESYRYTGGIDYTEETQGGQVRFGKVLSRYLTLRTGFRATHNEISDLPPFSSSQVRRYRGGSLTLANYWSLTRNTLDRDRDPARGARHDLVATVAGFGGDNNFVKLEHESVWFWPLEEEEKWVLSLRIREGWVTHYGASDFVPISDRFFAGGSSTLRGYDKRDVGPKERRYFFFWAPKDAVGGELRVLDSLELKYKLTKELRLYTFFDSGGVWETAGDFDPSDIKYSFGLGLGVDVPRMGPIRVDYGFPINPDEDQGSGRLHLMTGLRF